MRAQAESAIFIHDMGEGHLILAQRSDLSGNVESIALSFFELEGIIASLLPRYGSKNMDHDGALELA